MENKKTAPLETNSGSGNLKTEIQAIQSNIIQLSITHHVIAQVPVALLLLRGYPSIIEIANEKFLALLGKTSADIIGKRFSEVIPELQNKTDQDFLNGILKEGKKQTIEKLPVIIKRGNETQEVTLKIVFEPFHEANGNVTALLVMVDKIESQSSTNDIAHSSYEIEKLVEQRTAFLKASYEDLKKSEERYHKMVEEVQDYAIILLDKNGIVQNWNKGAEKIKQYKESEIIGKSFHQFYLPSDRQSGLPDRLIKEASVNGRALHEGWRVRKDGTVFWGSVTLTALHDEQDNIIGFSKVTRDLTARKLAEDQLNEFAKKLQQGSEALQKSEERYHKMINEVQDYAIILLSDQGDIENWNLGAQKIKGYTADEIIGKNFSTFYTQEDIDKKLPQHLLQEAASEGKAVHEGWRVRKDGSRFWGSIVLTALHGSDNSIIGFSKVTRDLTERKHAEDKMGKYLQELQLQNKELEQFAYVASHDLQEPLRKIKTFISIIQTKLYNEAAVKKYLEKINASASRMSELIKALLNYSRPANEEGVRVATDLNIVLQNVLVDFELLIEEKNASIHSGLLPVINAMPLHMNQLFANLISNSLKFSQGAVSVEIHARNVSGEQIINNPGNLPHARYLEISVADNGIGFEQQYEKRVFIMFQRLHGKSEYSGTGIGLALCKKIIDAHNGFITVRSDIGRGTTFYLYFPQEEDPQKK